MSKRPKNLDLNQLAKRIVDEASGEEPIEPSPEDENKAAKEKKRLDGLKGGKVRAQKLTAKQRSEIASLAASTRWHKVD
ncbi:MAG: histone H1 [Nitrosomonas sp.]|nr:histone H1 [Nitrosomonas sp.]MDP1949788.1 histone H1 [Nitrosomonas sp.]